jgi:hypothetical protein
MEFRVKNGLKPKGIMTIRAIMNEEVPRSMPDDFLWDRMQTTKLGIVKDLSGGAMPPSRDADSNRLAGFPVWADKSPPPGKGELFRRITAYKRP